MRAPGQYILVLLAFVLVRMPVYFAPPVLVLLSTRFGTAGTHTVDGTSYVVPVQRTALPGRPGSSTVLYHEFRRQFRIPHEMFEGLLMDASALSTVNAELARPSRRADLCPLFTMCCRHRAPCLSRIAHDSFPRTVSTSARSWVCVAPVRIGWASRYKQ